MRSSLCTDHLSEKKVMGLSYQDENIHTAGEKPFEGDQKVHHRSAVARYKNAPNIWVAISRWEASIVSSSRAMTQDPQQSVLRISCQGHKPPRASANAIPQCSMRMSNSNSGQGHKENGKGQIPLGEYATITWRYLCLLSFVDVKMLWSCLTPYFILRFRYSWRL